MKDPDNSEKESISLKSDAALPQPDVDDYWSHRVAEAAKKKVIAYFGILGFIVSVVITLFGADRIKNLLESEYKERVEAKETEASKRIEELSSRFETRLRSLQAQAEARTSEFNKRLDGSLASLMERATSVAPATSVDLSEYIGPIRDQGEQAGVVGYALAYALTAEVKKATGQLRLFSAQSIYLEAKRHDEWPGESYDGTSVSGGLLALQKVGAYLESDWPSDQQAPRPGNSPAQTISGFTEVDEQVIANAISWLQNNRPVVMSFTVTRDFWSPQAGGRVEVDPDPEPLGGTAACVVGYDELTEEFKLAFSWGSAWGAEGFMFIGRSDLERLAISAAVLELQVSRAVAPRGNGD